MALLWLRDAAQSLICQASTDRQSCSVLGAMRGALHGSTEGRCGVTGLTSTGHGAWRRRHCGPANSRNACKAQITQEGSVEPPVSKSVLVAMPGALCTAPAYEEDPERGCGSVQ